MLMGIVQPDCRSNLHVQRESVSMGIHRKSQKIQTALFHITPSNSVLLLCRKAKEQLGIEDKSYTMNGQKIFMHCFLRSSQCRNAWFSKLFLSPVSIVNHITGKYFARSQQHRLLKTKKTKRAARVSSSGNEDNEKPFITPTYSPFTTAFMHCSDIFCNKQIIYMWICVTVFKIDKYSRLHSAPFPHWQWVVCIN